MRFVILFSSVVIFLLCACHTKKDKQRGTSVSFEEHWDIPELEAVHVGRIYMDNGMAVIQVFDKKTRQNPRLFVADIPNKQSYGFFEWPAADESVYFACGIDGQQFFYLNDNKSIKSINLSTRARDTIGLPHDFSFFNEFVVKAQTIYSVNNVYGISTIKLFPSPKLLVIPPSKGHFRYWQNNLSIPIHPDQNLVSSRDINDSIYAVYAIDSSLRIKWERNLILHNIENPIQSIRKDDYYIVKAGKSIYVFSAAKGETIRTRLFRSDISDLFMTSNGNLGLFFSPSRDRFGRNSTNSDSVKIVLIDPKDLSTIWEQDIPGQDYQIFNSRRSLILLSTKKWYSLNEDSGELSLLREPGERRCIKDRISGATYINSGNSFWW